MTYALSGASRRGLTLIEVVIAIAILAIAASIIYPNLFRKDAAPSATTEASLIDQTKALAVARAETMRLSVARDGAWEIMSEATPGAILASGQMAEAPPAAFAVRVTELGACLPGENDRRVEGPAIDAVSCMVRP